MCPGMTRFVESLALGRTGSLVVRDTATLEVVREVPLINGRFPSIYEVACLSDDAELLAAIDARRGVTTVHVVRGSRERVAFSGDHTQAWFQGARAYVRSGSAVARLGLWGGSLEPVAQVPTGLDSIAVSYDERHVGGVLYGGSRRGEPPSEVVAVRSVDGATDVFALRGWNDSGDVHWLDDQHLVYLPGGADDDRAHVFSLPGLVRVGGFRGWYTTRLPSCTGVPVAWGGARCSAPAFLTALSERWISSVQRPSPRCRCRGGSCRRRHSRADRGIGVAGRPGGHESGRAWL